LALPLDPSDLSLSHEEGRVSYVGSDPEHHCGIKLNSLQEKDSGQWTCHFGFLSDDDKVRNTSRTSVLKVEKAGSKLGTFVRSTFGEDSNVVAILAAAGGVALLLVVAVIATLVGNLIFLKIFI